MCSPPFFCCSEDIVTLSFSIVNRFIKFFLKFLKIHGIVLFRREVSLMATFKDRLEEALSIRNMKPADLAKISGISEGAISQYRNGGYKATQRNLEKLSKALGVAIPWLMGYNVPIERDGRANIIPIGFQQLPEMSSVPLVGQIACGDPILAEENIEESVSLPSVWHANFALICKGDSMAPTVLDGDLVAIRIQPEVENGEIAAVRIGNEATLKRVYLHADYIELRPENPAFEKSSRKCRRPQRKPDADTHVF